MGRFRYIFWALIIVLGVLVVAAYDRGGSKPSCAARGGIEWLFTDCTPLR